MDALIAASDTNQGSTHKSLTIDVSDSNAYIATPASTPARRPITASHPNAIVSTTPLPLPSSALRSKSTNPLPMVKRGSSSSLSMSHTKEHQPTTNISDPANQWLQLYQQGKGGAANASPSEQTAESVPHPSLATSRVAASKPRSHTTVASTLAPPPALQSHSTSKALVIYVDSKEISSSPQLMADLGELRVRFIVAPLKSCDYECSTRVGVLHLYHKDVVAYLKGGLSRNPICVYNIIYIYLSFEKRVFSSKLFN